MHSVWFCKLAVGSCRAPKWSASPKNKGWHSGWNWCGAGCPAPESHCCCCEICLLQAFLYWLGCQIAPFHMQSTHMVDLLHLPAHALCNHSLLLPHASVHVPVLLAHAEFCWPVRHLWPAFVTFVKAARWDLLCPWCSFLLYHPLMIQMVSMWGSASPSLVTFDINSLGHFLPRIWMLPFLVADVSMGKQKIDYSKSIIKHI